MIINKPVALVTGSASGLAPQSPGSWRETDMRWLSIATNPWMRATCWRMKYASSMETIQPLYLEPIWPIEKPVRPLINDVSEKFGRLDMLVNNASLFGKTEIEKLTADDMDRYYHMHVTAPMILSATAAELLRKSGHGRIINIVDIFAKYPRVGFTPYTVSKAALVSLTKQLAVELAPDITVNSIAPGAILEPVEGMSEKEKEEIVSRIPLARFGSTVDIASAVLFLANADYITGQTIIIDGGRTLNI